MLITINNGKLQATVNTFGAELTSVKGNDGFEYMWQGEQWKGHAPVLFPLCGRILNGEYTYRNKLYKMNCHGFSPSSDFDVVSKTENSVTLSIENSDSTEKVYPFKFNFTVEYKLEGDKLFADFTVTNKDEEILPFMCGWHPAFALEGNSDLNKFYVDFGKDSLVMHTLANGAFLSGEKIPYSLNNGKYFIDDDEIQREGTLIFTGMNDSVVLASDCEKHSVELSYSKNNKYFCMWKCEGLDARYICLEPWSDVPCDGVTKENFETRKMSRLAPAEKETFSYTVKFNK